MNLHEILDTPLDEMLNISKVTTSYVTAIDIIDTFSPYIVHSGLVNVVTRYGCFDEYLEQDGELVVLEEIMRNRITNLALKAMLSKQGFYIGKIILPKAYRNRYSLFGLSRSDTCIYHCDSWKKGKPIKAAVIFPTMDYDVEDVEDDYGIVQDMLFELCSGVIEYKNEEHAIKQTVCEMIRTSGDLTARALLNGCQVSTVDIFGLALRYNQKSAKLLHLVISFEENTSRICVSEQPLRLHPAILWLLNCID